MTRKFTKSQRAALMAMKTYIATFEGGPALASLATMQLKINIEKEDEENLLESIKIWCAILFDVMDNIGNPEFQNDVLTLVEDMSKEFPHDILKQSFEDLKMH